MIVSCVELPANNILDWEYDLDTIFIAYPARLLNLVPRQLLPHGQFWLAYGVFFWGPKSGCLDDGVSV